MLPSRHDFPRRSRVALVAILWLAAGCRDRAPAPYADLAPPAPAVPHAQVERDLRDLRAAGALRVLFRYDSSNYFLHKGGQAASSTN
jgi:hypothetical protein